MKIEVRLFATLRENRGKVVTVEKEDGATAGSIISALKISKEDVAILLINGKDGDFDTPIKAGDYLSVFPPIGGG